MLAERAGTEGGGEGRAQLCRLRWLGTQKTLLEAEIPPGVSTKERWGVHGAWENTPSAPRNFKVRTTLPAGTWDWQVVGCAGTTGDGTNAQNCAQGTTGTPNLGSVSVTTPASATNIKLYDRGLLSQQRLVVFTNPPKVISYGDFQYADGSPFFWAADTAWMAPAREIGGQTAAWGTYLGNRKGKGFTVIQVAPAPAWTPGVGDAWPALPNSGALSFEQVAGAGCPSSAPVPNDCSRPKASYWDAFDNLVEQANGQDLVVAIVGVIDPVCARPASVPYPNKRNAEDFARYIAARLAGNHVVFSPGFDTQLTLRTHDNAHTTKQVIEGVGALLKLAAPRHPVGNHLAGRSTCPEYRDFATTALSNWMSFYFFQSGHAKNSLDATLQACEPRLAAESELRAALRRAREMPATLRTYDSNLVPPKRRMPGINGEGPYDAENYRTDPIDNRYRTRQAGHLSLLSGASGFAYGAERVVFWHQPGSAYFDLFSARDAQILFNRFRNRPPLTPRPEWIANQTPDPNHEEKMALASDGSSVVLGYVPGGFAAGPIQLHKSGLPSLTRGSGWTRKWFPAPQAVASTATVTCSETASLLTLGRPDCVPGGTQNPNCDWFLEMQRTSSTPAAPVSLASSGDVEVWVEGPDEATGQAHVRLALTDASVSGERQVVDVATSEAGFLGAPRTAQLGQDLLVLWEAETPASAERDLFLQRLTLHAAKLGEPIAVNSWKDHDQAQAALVVDAQGNTVVVWMSFGQDGDQGGIYGRLFNASLSPQGSEFPIHDAVRGHQHQPQIGIDGGGNFVVAWSTAPGEELASSISFRRFAPGGRARTAEHTLVTAGQQVELVDLAVALSGDFIIRWREVESSSGGEAIREQHFAPDGTPLANPVQLYP